MKKLILLFAILISFVSHAQTTDDVTLIVMGAGDTKEDAVNNALRSAVEQAFGVFVSANTEIINDELVKDEIATVTSGNIKSYKELSIVNLSDGEFTVSLEAIVSTKTLAVYAKNHGSSAEFAGATFGANLKLAKLNKINTEKVFENLVKQCEEIIPHIFETHLEVGNPTANGNVPMTIVLYSTPTAFQLSDLIVSSISALRLSEQEIAQMKEMNINIYPWKIISTDFERNWYAHNCTTDPYCWVNNYSYSGIAEGSLYAPIPAEHMYESLRGTLSKYCIKDNFNNIYSIDLKNVIVGKMSWIYDLRKETGEYLGRQGYYAEAMYTFHRNTITLPYDFLRPKKGLTFPRKMIGQYRFTLNIPIETLYQITSFEVTVSD